MKLSQEITTTVNRNLVILFLCQAVGVSGAAMVAIMGGIVGAKLAPSPNLASLPISLMIIGLALTTVPAAMLMKRIGRRASFTIAAYFSAAAVIPAAYAILAESFIIFCFATSLIGAHGAFVQQYRFAAAESVLPDKTAFGISTVLFGSVIGGYFGPQIMKVANGVFETPDFVIPLVLLSLLYLVAGTLLIFLRFAPGSALNQTLPVNQEKGAVKRSHLFLAMAAMTIAYGIMNLVMTATPISMHVFDGFSIENTASVIQAHIIAMYLPSFFTGAMIRRFGDIKIMLAGVFFLTASSLSVALDQNLVQYFVILILLGVGWNFLFISGTNLLVSNSPPKKRFRIQAINDFSVFGTAATASLLGGALIYATSWTTLNLITVPILIVLVSGILLIGFFERGLFQGMVSKSMKKREDSQ